MEELGSESALANAAHLWEFMDELAQNDPAEYERFLERNLVRQKANSEEPEPGFCIRMYESNTQHPFFVNVCSHPRIQPPNATPDGSIPLAVGVPREFRHQDTAALVSDVLVNKSVVSRAALDTGYREELAALATQCVKEVLSERSLLRDPFAAGYRVLAVDHLRYAGEACVFTDAKAGKASELSETRPDAQPAGASAREKAHSLIQQLGNITSLLPGSHQGKAETGGRGDDEGGGVLTRETEGDSLLLPVAMTPAAVKTGDAAPPGALIQEVSSTAIDPEVPKYELLDADCNALVLRCQLPLVQSAADVEVQIGDINVELLAEGLYKLNLVLPCRVFREQASCQFRKKTRTIVVRMPKAPPAG